MPKETITLYFKEGSSDKVYTCSIEEQGGGFTVPFAYGRRGSALTAGCKTTSPVPFDKAKKIFDALVREKMAKGYSPGAAGTPYVGTSSEKKATGIHCQLLNSIDESEVERLIKNDTFIAQEKFDGKRILLKQDASGLVAINRKGLECGYPSEIGEDAARVGGDFILDGELIGDTLYVFDLLSYDGEDLREQTYYERKNRLERAAAGLGHIRAVKTAKTTAEKKALFEQLKKDRKEGIVFKDRTAPYRAGRPNTGGSQLKFKFVATASCYVELVNSKRSIVLGLMENGIWKNVGNCTIPPNHEIPKAGQIVEIRYLYAYKGGSLYQPVYLGVRDDLDEMACQLSQLKYKADGTDSDEDA